MKKIVAAFLILSSISVSTYSCKNKEKANDPNNKKIETTTISNTSKDKMTDTQWKIKWADEFEKETIDSNNWTLQVVKAGRFNDEWQRYTNSDKNAYIENNCLVIKAIHESDKHGLNQYTSARLHTANKQSWKYGKIAARMKLPQGMGIWPAFWMLGANIDENGGDTPWPQCGEIDILELYGTKDDGRIESNVHYADSSGEHAMMGATSFKLDTGKFADAFHVFELEWHENRLAWFVDGKQFAEMDISSDELAELHKEFFILFNVAVGGTYAGRPNDTTSFPQHMYIDWVRVYEKS
ncbi:MAG: glycoside hydrolase family 16 protein [Saprospiraceae bacterium]|nr:glycoside hydrolase family 16 protein [Saprospiraceae bacterium]